MLCAGIPNNEATDGREAEKAFPDALCELMEMPLAVNYHGFDVVKDKINKGAFENSWYTLLANLFSISRNEIEQRDKRRQARQRRLRLAIAGAFFATVLVGLIVSLYSWRQAVIARNEAFSRELAAGSLGQLEADPDLSVKLALEALRSVQPASYWRLATTNSSVCGVWRQANSEAELPGHADLISDAAFSADSRRLVTGSWDKTARIWDVAAKRLLHQLPNHGASVISARFSPDGRLIATGDGAGKVRIWEAL